MLCFEQSCHRDSKKLIVREVRSLRLAWMLRNHGFVWKPLFDSQKTFV